MSAYVTRQNREWPFEPDNRSSNSQLGRNLALQEGGVQIQRFVLASRGNGYRVRNPHEGSVPEEPDKWLPLIRKAITI